MKKTTHANGTIEFAIPKSNKICCTDSCAVKVLLVEHYCMKFNGISMLIYIPLTIYLGTAKANHFIPWSAQEASGFYF